MKKIIAVFVFGVLAFGAGAIVGYHYEHAKNQSDISEIEQAALEACNARVKNIQKLCKK